MRNISPMVSTAYRAYRTKSGHSGIRAFEGPEMMPLLLVILPWYTLLEGFEKDEKKVTESIIMTELTTCNNRLKPRYNQAW